MLGCGTFYLILAIALLSSFAGSVLVTRMHYKEYLERLVIPYTIGAHSSLRKGPGNYAVHYKWRRQFLA